MDTDQDQGVPKRWANPGFSAPATGPSAPGSPGWTCPTAPGRFWPHRLRCLPLLVLAGKKVAVQLEGPQRSAGTP